MDLKHFMDLETPEPKDTGSALPNHTLHWTVGKVGHFAVPKKVTVTSSDTGVVSVTEVPGRFLSRVTATALKAGTSNLTGTLGTKMLTVTIVVA